MLATHYLIPSMQQLTGNFGVQTSWLKWCFSKSVKNRCACRSLRFSQGKEHVLIWRLLWLCRKNYFFTCPSWRSWLSICQVVNMEISLHQVCRITYFSTTEYLAFLDMQIIIIAIFFFWNFHHSYRHYFTGKTTTWFVHLTLQLFSSSFIKVGQGFDKVIAQTHFLFFVSMYVVFRIKHVMLTTFLLVCGAMAMNWLCDKITDSGFGIAPELLTPSVVFFYLC